MKNKFSPKFLTLLLALTMFLASCGKDDNTYNDNTASDSESSIEISFYDNLGEHDYESRTFTVVYSAEQLGTKWPYQADEMTADILNDAVYNREKTVEDKFNVRIEWYDTRGTADKVASALRQSVMAGDQSYQLGIGHMFYGLNGLIADSLLYDFKKLPVIDLESPWWNQSANRNLEIAGVLLTTSSDLIYKYWDVIYFNKGIMDDFGIDYPYQTVYDGTWTWDYLATLTKGITSDIDGDGNLTEYDRYAFLVDANVSLMTRLIHSNGLLMAKTDDNGHPTLDDMVSDKLYSVIEKYYSFLWEGDDCYYASKNSFNKLITELFALGNSMMMHTTTSSLASLRDVDFEFGIVPLPKYDEAQEGYYTLASTQMLLLPADIEDGEFVGTILEALTYESYMQVVPELYDVLYTNKLLRDEESESMFELIKKSTVYDLNWNYGQGNNISYLVGRTVGQHNENVASYVAANIDAAQQKLDDVYDAIVENYVG